MFQQTEIRWYNQKLNRKFHFFSLLIYDNRHLDPSTTRPHPSDPELKLVGLKLNKRWSHLCCCWPFLFPSFLPAPAVKSLFYPSFCEAAKTRGNGVYRGGTEELVHICTVLVTTLTLQQSLRESKMVPVGRPARRCWHVLLRLSHIWACSGRYLLFVCRAALPEPRRIQTRVVGMDSEWNIPVSIRYWDQSSHTSGCCHTAVLYWCSSPVLHTCSRCNICANSLLQPINRRSADI